MTERRTRSLTLTADLLRAYSRRGNVHADPAAARELGLTELVAQGMQVAGPAYALLLDAWGEDWLAHGELELTFVAMVTAGETVDAEVELDGDDATVCVTAAPGTARVVGRARRSSALHRTARGNPRVDESPPPGQRRAVAGPEARPELRVPRPDESAPADEMTMARGWLTHLRESAISKLEGLDAEQLRWRPAPTANSLGAIVVHLGYAERLWLRVFFAGEEMDLSWREHMFELPAGWSTADVVAFYRAETAAADAVLDRATSFDLRSASERRPSTLRWIVVHLLEETARHCGHMDVTRELLDGRTGR